MQMIIPSYTFSQQGNKAIGALRMIAVILYHIISLELQRSGLITHRDGAAIKAATRPPTAHTAVLGGPLLPRRSTYSVKPWRAECEVRPRALTSSARLRWLG